ncbi:MAG: D-glycero-beta-D-manno-heptose 1-phosphate adenylyltransferase, partial [Eubacteriales bacterium]|nr:D-glycero-beta-D-manno-heptose 1-phosphate adenylyltransferase [Eubacteriales bacterium]
VIGGNQQIVRFDEETAEVVSPGTEERISAAMLRLLESANGVLLSDYGKGVLKGNLCKTVISGALRRGVPVFVDPKGRDWERYRGATCVTPNEAEFFAVSGESTDERGFFSRNALEIKSRFEINNLLVTRGAKGIAFFPEEGDPCFAPAPRVREVYDVSGAGDTVVAVLAASVVSGYSWDYGVSLANRAAGIVITRVGTSPVSMEDLSGPVEEDSKICTWAEAERRVALWKKNGASVVFTNGCFDLLHPGHIKVLRQAAREGDRLVVGLNSDASVCRLKGPDRPVLHQADRASILAALDCVDLVVVFEEDTPENLIRVLVPSVLVKGGDYTPESIVGRKIVEEGGGRVVIVPLMEGKSTTNILLSFKKR